MHFLILYHFFCGQDIILSHLLERYLNNQIYTYIGDILIAVNPLQTLNLYGPEVSVQKFFITVFQLAANYFISVFSSNIWRTISKELYYFQLYHSKIIILSWFETPKSIIQAFENGFQWMWPFWKTTWPCLHKKHNTWFTKSLQMVPWKICGFCKLFFFFFWSWNLVSFYCICECQSLIYCAISLFSYCQQ